jgi:hypothetical protein
MKKILAVLMSTAAVAGATYAIAGSNEPQTKAEIKYKDNGGYEINRSSEKVGPGGTKTTVDRKTDVEIDSDGHISRSAETEKVQDPKGLLNKATSKEETEYEESEDGFTQKSTSEQKSSDGTHVSEKTTNDVTLDDDGNVEAVIETEKKVDPKGLFNSKTVSEKTELRNGQVVKQEKEVD